MAVSEFKPATCAADVSDWITPEEVIRLALSAFYGECTRWRAEPDPEAGPGWYTREAFAEFLADRLSGKLLPHAHSVGVRKDQWSADRKVHLQDFPDWTTPFEFKPAIGA